MPSQANPENEKAQFTIIDVLYTDGMFAFIVKHRPQLVRRRRSLAFLLTLGILLLCRFGLNEFLVPPIQQEARQLDDSRAETPRPFKFYVYDNLPDQVNIHTISNCIEDQFRNGATCPWSLKICTEETLDSNAGRYLSWRTNHNADVAIVNLFQTYPYPGEYTSSSRPATASFATRTQHAHQADVFVVPYAHDSHCKCTVRHTWCEHQLDEIKAQLMQQSLHAIFQSLPHYAANASRHLFISSSDFPFAHSKIQNSRHLRTTLGDLRTPECVSNGGGVCGNFVIPYLNTNVDYQPLNLLQRPHSWWTTRSRTYSVVAHFGYLGGKQEYVTTAGGRNITIWRNSFLRHWQEFLGDSVGGLPVSVGSLGGRYISNATEHDFMQVYQQSTFCLVLPGDGPPQKRFFDVIMSGCIPVVLSFQQESASHPSWFTNRASPSQPKTVRQSYPFPRGFFWDNPQLGIDFFSFVVQLDGDHCELFQCLKPTLEAILQNTTELTRLRTNLKRHAVLFSYGLEENSFRYFDAFAVLLWQLGHYLERA